jgi:hypothetical protein
MSLNATKGKKQVTQANPKLLTPMMQANLNFVLGKPMLNVDALKQAGKFCVELHNYYINNYSKSQDIWCRTRINTSCLVTVSFSSHGLISMTFSTLTRWISG